MLSPNEIKKFNALILQKLSLYLNLHSDFIEESIINELVHECGLTTKEAFSLVLAQALGLDLEENAEDKALYYNYFEEMLAPLDLQEYADNLYYKNIKIPNAQIGRWEFKHEKYKPYEAFVYNDLKQLADGRIIPQIGFFEKDFSYPAVFENNREWMLITPNEIETMKAPIAAAHGKVLTFGLGLGYYAYMVSEKENVATVTIVEKDENVIKLFKQYILPQFAHPEKIHIIHEDAFIYAKKYFATAHYDVVFTDIWHDPADGVDLYLKMKEYEKLSPESEYWYWIEDTMICYL
nr:hypothetical protein [uncultured Cellulosilyticum sp.]